MNRLKVLISAYSCEPGRGSEPGIGWNFAREIAKYHDVFVLTRPDESKDAIEKELERTQIPSLKFIYFTLPFWQDSMRLGQSGAMQIHYYLWQIQAYFVARRLHKKIRFDVAHHVTFLRYSTPSFVSLLPIPFVLGSVGGGEKAPRTFLKDLNTKSKLYEVIRELTHKVGEYDPFTRLTVRNSAAVRATTYATAKQLYKMGAQQVQTSLPLGLSLEEINHLEKFPLLHTSPIRFISIGRLLHWKGFHLGIRAFAKANIPDAEYWILGDGPEMTNLKIMAHQLGVDDRVIFFGWLPRPKTLEKLNQSHALVHPSLHDSGGWVCLEAMAAGRPVLCLDLGGPAVQVNHDTGIRIPAHTPEQAVDDLSKAIVQLAKDSVLREAMGTAGRQLVREQYSWQAKGKEISQLYQQLCHKTTSAATSECQ